MTTRRHSSKPIIVTPGDVYGRLTIIQELDRHRRISGVSVRMFLTQCECGTQKRVSLTSMRSGATVSCGCYHNKLASINLKRFALKHGQSGTKLFWVWCSMRERCHNPKNKSYPRYGGRGISVCQEWRDSFEAFANYVGERPPGLTLDRINTYGNYEPGNVRWADYKEQARNRRNCITVEVNGKRMNLAAACEVLDIPYEKTRVALKHQSEFMGVCRVE